MIIRAAAVAILMASTAFAQVGDDRFGPDDLARLAEVAEPAFSPDGSTIAYSLTTTNAAADKKQSDLSHHLPGFHSIPISVLRSQHFPRGCFLCPAPMTHRYPGCYRQSRRHCKLRAVRQGTNGRAKMSET